MENLFVSDFSSIVCDVILKEQEDKHLNETHQLPCLKRNLVHSALLCIWFADEKQIRQTQRMELFIVTYCSYGTEVCSPQINQGSCTSSRGRSSLVERGA